MRWVLLAIAAVLLLAFKKDPPPFPKPAYPIPSNASEIELGRLLFFDPILSADSTISCASCHSPYNAFAHTDHALSHGIHDSIGKRNAPALFNLAWHKEFMWDGAINHIDVQALAPIAHPAEMGSSIQDVLHKLRASTFYKSAFHHCFATDSLETKHVLKALAAFELSLVSNESRYDQIIHGKGQFSEQELKGMLLHQKHCSSCHSGPLFSTYGYASNGLQLDEALVDAGRYEVTQNPIDSFQFKIPSLRNLRYTAPYMHDGRFKSLREVLAFYGEKEKTSHAHAQVKSIQLTPNEQKDILAFLETLNDSAFVFNPKHQFPKIVLQKNEGVEGN